MSAQKQIVLAQPRDANILSHLIALAFHDLAPSVWLIPDADARGRLLPGYFRLLVHEAMTLGRVYTTSDHAAVALWLPAPQDVEPEASDYDAQLAATTGIWADRFRIFDALLAKHHVHGTDHDHLAILAVHPEHQQQGLGSALLAAHHARLDAEDPPRAAYLEASDATTRQLYLRRGYSDVGDPIALPSGACMFPMVRRPSGA